MKRISKMQLGRSSYLLVIAASISLFMLIVFFSYSLYGGKGTYSADSVVTNDGECASKTCYECISSGTTDVTYRLESSNPNPNNCTPTPKTNCGCTIGIIVTKYTIIFDANGGTFSSGVTTYVRTITGSETLYFPKNVTRVGYTFMGWNTAKNGLGNDAPGPITSCTENHTYYAKWEKNSAAVYTVNFDADGGKIGALSTTSVQVESGQKVSEPLVPTKNGYTFKGWKKSNGAYWNFSSDVVTSSITLTASWESTGSKCWECKYGNSNDVSYAQWSTTNPKSGDNNWLCTSTSKSQANCVTPSQETCWECKYGNSNDVSYAEWRSTNPKSGDNNWLCTKTSKSQANCVTASTATCWECKYGNSNDVSYREWSSTNPKAGNNNWLCTRSLATQANCTGSSSENPSNPSNPSDGGGDGGNNPSGGGNNDGENDNSGGTTPTPSEEPTNPGVEYTDEINGDRCYKGTWVRVVTCQPASVSSAQCKLKDGTLVLRSDFSYGCEELTTAYTDIIDDYRCNKESGKWIYISSCQPNATGSQCKTGDSTILKSSLTNGPGCSASKPGTSNGGTPGGGSGEDNNVSNPKTGTIEMIIAFMIGIIALIVSWYYFKKNKVIDIKG